MRKDQVSHGIPLADSIVGHWRTLTQNGMVKI